MSNTVIRGTLAGLFMLASAGSLHAQGGFPAPAGAGPGPGGRIGGPNQPERKLVEQFDRDGDKRLNASERQAALQFLSQQGGARGGGGMRGAGPGGGRGGVREPAIPGIKIAPTDVPTYREPIYDVEVVRTFFLTFESDSWERELAAFNNTDIEVPATLMVDGKGYRDVGVHFRGASSFSSVPEGYKRSFNLTVDFVHAEQAIGGYRTFNLLNSNGDPTFMRTILYQQIAREYIPAPKANFVRLVINGENWGVYSSALQFNKDFARDFYSETEGARWKVPGGPNGRGGLEYLGDDHAAYKAIYTIKSKDTPKSWNDLIAFTKVLNETPADKLEAALAPIFDTDGALKFLALEIALVNNDGYWVRSSDYNIYQDMRGRFHIVPHDANETFSGGGGPGGRGGAGRPGGPGGPGAGRGGPGGGGVTLDPFTGVNDPSKPLISKLLAAPTLRARYASYVRDIATKWLDWQTLGPIAQRYQALLKDHVEADTRKLDTFEAFLSGVDSDAGGRMSIKAFADQRRAFLLAHPGIRTSR